MPTLVYNFFLLLVCFLFAMWQSCWSSWESWGRLALVMVLVVVVVEIACCNWYVWITYFEFVWVFKSCLMAWKLQTILLSVFVCTFLDFLLVCYNKVFFSVATTNNIGKKISKIKSFYSYIHSLHLLRGLTRIAVWFFFFSLFMVFFSFFDFFSKNTGWIEKKLQKFKRWNRKSKKLYQNSWINRNHLNSIRK